MLLIHIQRVPIVQSLTSFPKAVHQKSLKKFMVLWILSILPIVFAISISRRGDNSSVWSRINTEFSATEQFVYAASLLSPMLYFFYEKYDELRGYVISKKRSPEALRQVPRGFEFVLFIALLLFVYTAFAFGAARLRREVQGDAVINFAMTAPVVVYFYSLFCWYLMIAMSMDPSGFDFVKETRKQATDVQAQLSDRVKGGGDV